TTGTGDAERHDLAVREGPAFRAADGGKLQQHGQAVLRAGLQRLFVSAGQLQPTRGRVELRDLDPLVAHFAIAARREAGLADVARALPFEAEEEETAAVDDPILAAAKTPFEGAVGVDLEALGRRAELVSQYGRRRRQAAFGAKAAWGDGSQGERRTSAQEISTGRAE